MAATTLSTAGTTTLALQPGQTLIVSTTTSSEATISETLPDPSGGNSTLSTNADPQRRLQGRTFQIGPVAFNHVFGPYDNGCTITIVLRRGSLTYTPSSKANLQGPVAAQGIGVGPTGLILDARGMPIQHANGTPGAMPLSQCTASVWFPLNEGSGTDVFDQHGSLQGILRGSANARWTALGLTLDGSNQRIECNVANSNQPQYSSLITASQEGYSGAMQHLADLASLASRGDMILISAVISHPATGLAAEGAIASFGMDNDPSGQGGWGVGIKNGAAGKMRFWHRGVGGSATDSQDISAQGVTGNGNNNTRTAVCFCIAANPVNSTLEIYGYQLTLGVDGGRQQNNVGLVTPDILTNGATAACGPNPSNPLCIGAMGDNKPFANLVGATTVATGASNHLTLGTALDLTYSLGRWMWLPAIASTPALTAKRYWVVMSSTTVGTIYTNGPGSAAYNFSAGAAAGAVSQSFVRNFAGGIRSLVLQRRPFNHALGMLAVRDLRRAPDQFPRSLG